jgi:hypothetical protein
MAYSKAFTPVTYREAVFQVLSNGRAARHALELAWNAGYRNRTLVGPAWAAQLRSLVVAFNQASVALQRLIGTVNAHIPLAGTANVPVPQGAPNRVFSSTWAPYAHWFDAMRSAAGDAPNRWANWRVPLPSSAFERPSVGIQAAFTDIAAAGLVLASTNVATGVLGAGANLTRGSTGAIAQGANIGVTAGRAPT